MKLYYYQSSVFFSFLLFTFSTAHTEAQTNSNNNNNNGPLFGSVMRYFGESENGGTYGLPSTGLFEDVDSPQVQQQVSMCLPNFEVSIGSIIRTKDSQALGAHYLNETDVGAKSRDDCLKLCCKVSRCNVAVFEEKNSGSCYLFDCGSLEEFRCKFTSQSHYVSAILRRREIAPPQQPHNGNANPSLPEHSGSIMGAHSNGHSHNQHEDELSQLRDSDKTSGGGPLAAAVIPAAVVAAGVSNLPDVSSNSKQTGGGEITQGSNSGSSSTSSSTTSPVVLSDVNNAHQQQPYPTAENSNKFGK